jgi:hypothetical protein
VNGAEFARLEVNLTDMRATIRCGGAGAAQEHSTAWDSNREE